MNKIFKSICVGILLFSTFPSWGQTVQLTENPEEFTKNLQTILSASNKPDARKAGDDFVAAWQSGKLSQSQQKQIIGIGLKMQKRKVKGVPGFDHFAAIISLALNENISSTQIDKLLEMTEKVVDKQANNNILLRYLTNLRVFFEKDALHTSNYNSLIVSGGSYTFDYLEIKEPEMVSLEDQPITESQATPQSTDQSTDNSNWFNDWDTPGDTGSIPVSDDMVAATAEVIQPTIEGPIIKFEKTNFIIKTSFDSSSITGTSGSYMLLSEIFVGEGGRFDWSAAGLDPSVVYAEFSKYNFRVKSPSVEAEKVKLTYPTMVDQPVEGVFEYKSKKHKTADDAQYPRFKSYSNNIKVKNIGKNITYTGGFALGGNKIYSSSVNEGVATIKVNIDGSEKFKSTSSRFQLGDSIISSQRASVTIYNKGDTVSHPAIELKYNKNSGDLRIKKDEGGYKNMPFRASAFKVDFLADVIKWNVNTDSMDISILGARNQVPAIFESTDFFNDKEFDDLKGIYSFHPLQLAVNYANATKSRSFYAEDLAKKNKLNPGMVKSSLVELHQRGFLDLNFATGYVTLKDKAFHFSDSRRSKKDFDNMLIPSLIASRPNATLNLTNQSMKIRGIKQFYLSDSLNTYIRPTNAEITLLKNRDFQFSGTINSGNFEFFGSDFKFKYDSFIVAMSLIDSIKLTIETVDEKGNKVKKQLDNQLEFSSGTLYINDPDNKSSRKKYMQYPIFDASTGATVFFDGKEINKGSYDKSLSFEIPPFRIDSLSASDPAAIGFEGTFKSGIFPDFKEKLKVREDGSLGFVHKVPSQGYPIFGGVYKGSANDGNFLTMSEKGLRGGGTIEYLTSTFESKEFIFYIDSVKTNGTLATVKAGTLNGASYPDITVENYRMKWLPKKDTLSFANMKTPIQLYNKTATLNGKVNLSTKGLFGNGNLVTRGSEAKSQFFTFREKQYLGRQATFAIRSDDPKKPAFTGNDVKLDFNLEENYARIVPEVQGNAALNFPYSQYRSSINEAIWKLDEKKILMSVPEGSDASNSYFYSTRKDQDSLVFNATNAEYDIQKLTLNIKGVPFIKVADAKIIPHSGEVSILENANFQPLTKAELVIDTLNEYHNLYDGNLNILSRSKFTGNGTYRFVNTVKDTFAIKFDRFELEKVTSRKNEEKLQTVSSGKVSEEDKFLIAPKIYFRGKATMYANRKPLELDGHVKLELSKFPEYNRWIVYKRTGDVDEIVIDFDKNITDTGRKLTAGLHLNSDDNSLYYTFADDKKKPVDQDIFLGNGLLTYNEDTKQFRLIDSLKDKGQSYEGNSITYDEENSLLKFEGKLNLIKEYKDFGVVSSGNGVVKIDSGVYTLNTLLGLNYNIPSKATELLASHLKEVIENTSAAASTTDKTDLLYKIGAIAGNAAAKTYDQKSSTGVIPLSTASSQFLKTFVLSDVNFRWSEPFKAFYSVGKINLASVMNTPLDARINGFIEIRKTPGGGEVVSVFLEATSETFYFFRFENNKLWVFSSDEKFNAAVDSKSKGESVKPGQYGFVMSNMADMLTYIDRFRKNYLGILEPYRFEGTKEEVQEEKQEEKPKESDDGF
jgi:hypothetical protein